jgi:RHS repeat-associated protein
VTTTSAISTVRDAYYNGSSWTVGGTNGRAFGPVDMKYVVSQTRTHNGQNGILTIQGSTSPTYDNNGNTTKDDTGKQYVYDAWNRIMTVKNSGGTVLEYMKYMANAGRGTAGTSGCSYTTTQTYYSMDWQVLQKVDTLTPPPPCQSGVTTSTYVWSLSYIDDLVAKDTSGGRTYVQQDANHNVTALVNTSGTVTQRQIYDPYGVATVLTSGWGSSGNSMFEYGHQGGRYDSLTGLYNFRMRDYSPTLGRWMQQDPMGYVDGLNLYEFVRSGPAGNVDPWGLFMPRMHRQFASVATKSLGAREHYASGIIGADVAVDMPGNHFSDPEYHAQAAGWDRLVQDRMRLISTFPWDPRKYAGTELLTAIGEAMHTLADYYAHTDWIDGYNMLPVYLARGDNGMIARAGITVQGGAPGGVIQIVYDLTGAHRPHGSELINLDMFYEDPVRYTDVITYEGGTTWWKDDPHNWYAADKPNAGRDASLPGAYQKAASSAQSQTTEFLRWARDHMNECWRKRIFGV